MPILEHRGRARHLLGHTLARTTKHLLPPEGLGRDSGTQRGTVVLRLEGERRRVHIRRFDHVIFPMEEEARHIFIRLWREVEMLESASQIELTAEHWLEASR